MKSVAFLALVACLTACNVAHVGDETADGGSAAEVDGGGRGCEAAYCCDSTAQLPEGLICGVCNHDYAYGVVCQEGEVVCDPKVLDDGVARMDGYKVLEQQDWESGDGGCTAGGLRKPDGGVNDGGTGPDAGLEDAGLDGGSPNPVVVVFGAAGIIDGRNVQYREDWDASWHLNTFTMNSSGSLSFSIDFKYSAGPFPGLPQLRHAGSAMLSQVWASYRDDRYGDSPAIPLSPIQMTVCAGPNEDNCTSTFSGVFDMPGPLPEATFSNFDIFFSWLRVYRGGDGAWYFQWIQVDSGKKAHPPILPLDTVVTDLPGYFLVYRVISALRTHPIEDGYPGGTFDYVNRAKELFESKDGGAP